MLVCLAHTAAVRQAMSTHADTHTDPRTHTRTHMHADTHTDPRTHTRTHMRADTSHHMYSEGWGRLACQPLPSRRCYCAITNTKGFVIAQ